jgi:hypothetical protein
MALPLYTSPVGGFSTIVPGIRGTERRLKLPKTTAEIQTKKKSELRLDAKRNAHYLTKACMGCQPLTINSDQRLISLDERAYLKPCDPGVGAWQFSIIFKDCEPEIFSSCVHNALHSMI